MKHSAQLTRKDAVEAIALRISKYQMILEDIRERGAEAIPAGHSYGHYLNRTQKALKFQAALLNTLCRDERRMERIEQAVLELSDKVNAFVGQPIDMTQVWIDEPGAISDEANDTLDEWLEERRKRALEAENEALS
jgi:regulator of sigma D